MAQLIVQKPRSVIPCPNLETSSQHDTPIFDAARFSPLGSVGQQLPRLPTNYLSGGELDQAEIGKGEIEYVQHRDTP